MALMGGGHFTAYLQMHCSSSQKQSTFFQQKSKLERPLVETNDLSLNKIRKKIIIWIQLIVYRNELVVLLSSANVTAAFSIIRLVKLRKLSCDEM